MRFANDAIETRALRAILGDEAALADMASVNAAIAAQGMAFAASGYAKMAQRATSEAVRKRRHLRADEDAAKFRFGAVVDGAVRVAKNATYDAFIVAQRAMQSAVAAGVEHRRKDAAMLYDLIGRGAGVNAEEEEAEESGACFKITVTFCANPSHTLTGSPYHNHRGRRRRALSVLLQRRAVACDARRVARLVSVCRVGR